jgi:hypothetical protein
MKQGLKNPGRLTRVLASLTIRRAALVGALESTSLTRAPASDSATLILWNC